ncbi:hydroxymethylglutaryl-CoA lyase [Nocardioides sp. CFH 31398]|uniref:hydroxymethylglutaryl-CoA lyase n=1 Tax=Nocardioides sp. CFH 31398 TaxID=2919579 RepID=UPI001F068472|nr:hydroxymethylglutaryl-CoA lyase [Nocardioides sp. CFH 31398]MCH1865331.1 hydroxymethylglutaryl-CoA lyase [Nocardioides sp. CFH 31398]
MSAVELVEVGPRDGLQNEDRALPPETRVALVERLVAAGVRRLETVSFVRPDRVPQMAGAEEVMAAVPTTAPDGTPLTHVGLVLNERGARRAVETAVGEINVVVPVTDEFCTRNQGTTVDGMLDHAAAAVEVARGAGVGTSVTLAVAFGCPFAGTVSTEHVAGVVDRVLALGVDELAFADTVGVGVPTQVAALADLLPRLPDAPRLRFHFHNTRNTGYANAWAAVALGRRVALDASVGGFGGCPFAPAATGNIASEDLHYMLERAGVAVTPVDRGALVDTAGWLSKELDSGVQALLGKAGEPA